jgi:uncharacterized protein DUF6231
MPGSLDAGSGTTEDRRACGIPADCKANVIQFVETLGPNSILAVGPEAQGLFADYLAVHSECSIRYVAGGDVLEQLTPLGSYGFGFVSHVFEHMDKTSAGTLIARLRDVHTRCFLAIAPSSERIGHNSQWEPIDFISYGMSFVARYETDRGPIGMYKFNIYDYKPAPEWLNGKYWAHPELFDKFRW